MFSFLKRRQTDPKAGLRKVLGEYVLPSFPGVAMQVLQKLRDPECSAASIAQVLSVDPGLSVRVLRIANSPSFSPARKIENLSQAVALMGLAQLESLILSAGVNAAIPRGSAKGYDSARFWRAAARRGLLARDLAGILCPARRSECFTAGLLQDLAIPFLARQNPDGYGSVLHRWHTGGGCLVDIERAAFDWDHAEVATWICSEWAIPESIAAAIGGHHGTDAADLDCPAPVALAALIRECDAEGDTQAFVETAEMRCGIPASRGLELLTSSADGAQELARMMR